ncbi:MAG TPA: DUF2905 domain-containing protein [Bryobacteraceae bacterium]|nr:DUF2905 domain-containing protein [Bryobacteraceae bacterium]
MGRFLVSAGVLLIMAGIVVILGERVGIRLGRLPGDIRIEGKHGAFYFPLMTCILLSVALSLISWLFTRR